jgi:hypothetical protein
MAKVSNSADSKKINFGKKKLGKYKKKYGPKDNRPKKYVGQGR